MLEVELMRRPSSEDAPPVREVLVTQPDELAACCQHLAACPRLGLDTEFVGEDSYHPNLCLIQVAAPDVLRPAIPQITVPCAARRLAAPASRLSRPV